MQENGRKLASKVSSRVEDLLGIVYPIIQAPFGGFASQRLTATVSNLGGLGSLGVVSQDESAIRDAVVEMLSLTNKPFAVNLWVSTSDPQLAFIDHDTAAKKIVELAQYYAELAVEAPSVPQIVPRNFKAQCYAAINAGAPVLSLRIASAMTASVTSSRKLEFARAALEVARGCPYLWRLRRRATRLSPVPSASPR